MCDVYQLDNTALQMVSTYLSNFEMLQKDIQHVEDIIKELRSGEDSAANTNEREVTIKRKEKELTELIEKIKPFEDRFSKIPKVIVQSYVNMLTYPNLKASELRRIKLILQTMVVMSIDHWRTALEEVGNFICSSADAARQELMSIVSSGINGTNLEPRVGSYIYQCIVALAEGVFSLIVQRLDRKPEANLSEKAEEARSIAAAALKKLFKETQESVWKPFLEVSKFVDTQIEKEKVLNASKYWPRGLKILKPYVEAYFLMHDTLRCVTCPLGVLIKDLNELVEEQEAWSGTQQDTSRAAKRQTASFKRSHSLEMPTQDINAYHSPSKHDTQGLEEDFQRFAEHHRRLVNIIVSHDPSVLEEAMTVLLKFPKLLDFENKYVLMNKVDSEKL